MRLEESLRIDEGDFVVIEIVRTDLARGSIAHDHAVCRVLARHAFRLELQIGGEEETWWVTDVIDVVEMPR